MRVSDLKGKEPITTGLDFFFQTRFHFYIQHTSDFRQLLHPPVSIPVSISKMSFAISNLLKHGIFWPTTIAFSIVRFFTSTLLFQPLCF